MNLATLCATLAGLSPADPDVWSRFGSREVAQITSDSRQVRPGTVFVALPGEHVDGHDFIPQAIEAGALAVVVQDGQRETFRPYLQRLPVLLSRDTYESYALLSSQFFGWPGKALQLIGVTGTNGKTTVTHLIETMLKDAGETVGLLGTLGKKTSSQPDAGYTTTGHTTPMAWELQQILAELRDLNTQSVVMEVSSHALAQYRVAGCDFRLAVITNLTQDHLDFHQTMDRYAEAKALLFSGLNAQDGPRGAVINLDDAYAPTFLNAVPSGVDLWTYGVNAPEARIRAEHVENTIQGARYEAVTPMGRFPVQLQMAGLFSVYNSLAALASGLALGLPPAQVVQSLGRVPGVRGRFEVVSQEPFVLVDYAHTPDGLENILSAARQVTPEGGQLIVVFGCGGDRDATKRPKMGRIAERLADRLVITSDNPRSEDPQQILSDILAGIERFDADRMRVQPDREQAIHLALDLAGPKDIVVVAGKGHEDYQILADRVIHFDDKEVVQAYVARQQARLGVGGA